MKNYRLMVCPRCGCGQRVYGDDDPYHCPYCDERDDVEVVLVEDK